MKRDIEIKELMNKIYQVEVDDKNTTEKNKEFFKRKINENKQLIEEEKGKMELIERMELKINQQFHLVKDLLEEIQEGETTVQEAKEVLSEGLRDFRLLKDIIGYDDKERVLLDKIMRIEIAAEELQEGNVKQALFNLEKEWS